MQVVSIGDILHEISNLFSEEKKIGKNVISLSSAELAESGKSCVRT